MPIDYQWGEGGSWKYYRALNFILTWTKFSCSPHSSPETITNGQSLMFFFSTCLFFIKENKSGLKSIFVSMTLIFNFYFLWGHLQSFFDDRDESYILRQQMSSTCKRLKTKFVDRTGFLDMIEPTRTNLGHAMSPWLKQSPIKWALHHSVKSRVGFFNFFSMIFIVKMKKM